MPEVTTELVKKLRNATGISIMQCRKALEEAEGDMEKAIAILKKVSSDIAQGKQGREANDGSVAIKISDNKAVMVTLYCETDFVSKNEDFLNLLQKLADLALEGGASKTKSAAKEVIDPVIQKTGEKIQLGDIQETSGGVLGSYVHNNKIGVVVSLEGGTKELAKDIAMHYSAMKPEYISSDEIDENSKKTVQEIFEKEVREINKPEEIKKKMLEGKINSYFAEKTLLSQAFIKNGEETVGELLKKNNAKIKEIRHSFV